MENILFAGAILALAGLAWWYWRRGTHPLPDCLKPGSPLPLFTARTEDGNRIDSTSLEGAPAVILFVRGSWCPFCSAQVEDLTKYYKDIVDLGARLIFVTPAPLETTRRVAEMFGVDFEFWLDEDLSAAKALKLLHRRGVPAAEKPGYGSDTVWPTSLVVDAGGTIRFVELSKHIVDRPEPRTLLRSLRSVQEA
ncbi:MAG: redoxin domain-containing protein [Woeseiaceae bacterium]|nr:redoxin domain-containing protein [Woeseiaceae bacterium]